MCHASCINFGIQNLTEKEIQGKRVIEVGSYNVNGSLRNIIEEMSPAEYIGVDITEGPGVDIICNADDLVKKFGENSFDIVISTEMMEHIRNWREVISNLKKLCKPNGIILITTRSYGFEYHGWPYDFWRYEVEDMKEIFSDCNIQSLEPDNLHSGVFIKAIKPINFVEKNFKDYKLHNIVVNQRRKEFHNINYLNPAFTWQILVIRWNKLRVEQFLQKVQVKLKDLKRGFSGH